ncbi:MAG: hypothetical protein C5B59_13745 [Bacteroidetes bacterium]|nr:MAG: hypothetical protein C5B59_13745 [Bacteroidota bacterium]
MSQASFVTGSASQTFGNPSSGDYFIIDQYGRFIARLTDFQGDGINLLDMGITSLTMAEGEGLPNYTDETNLTLKQLATTSYLAAKFNSGNSPNPGLGFIDIYIGGINFGAVAPVNFYFYTDSGGSPGAPVAGSAASPTGLDPTNGGQLQLSIWRIYFSAIPGTLTPNTDYWFVFKINGAPSGWDLQAPLNNQNLTGITKYSTDGASWASVAGNVIFKIFDGNYLATGLGSFFTDEGAGLSVISNGGTPLVATTLGIHPAVSANSSFGPCLTGITGESRAIDVTNFGANGDTTDCTINVYNQGGGISIYAESDNGDGSTDNTGPAIVADTSSAPNGYPQIRLVPGGDAGAPSHGPYTQGDMYMDSAGSLHICTVGGSPGTWKTVTVS